MRLFLLLSLILLLGWLAGRHVSPVGKFYAWVFRPLANALTSFEQYLAPFKTKADRDRPGLKTIVRLLAGCVAALACVSEVYGGMQAAGTLFDVADSGLPLLPANLAIPALGVTFLCLAILAGMGYLETEESIPVQARVFELDQTKTARMQKRMLWCLVLSLLATFFAFLERKLYLINPDSIITLFLQILVFALLGILLPLLLMFAWYLIAVGLEGLVSLVLGIFHFLVTMVRDFFLFLANSFGGREQAANQNRTIVAEEEPSALPNPPPAGLLPAPSNTKTHESEAIPMPDAVVACNFVGAGSQRFIAPMRKELARFDAGKFIRSWSVTDLDHPRPGSLGFGSDLTIPYPEQRATLSQVKKEPEAYQLLLDRLHNKQADVFQPLRELPSLSLHFLDCHIGVASLAYLPDLHDRLRFQTQVAIISVSPLDLVDAEVVAFLEALQKLHTDKILTITLVTDPTSLFAQTYTDAKQDEFTVHALVDWLRAHTNSPRNASAIELFKDIGRDAPFISLSAASRETAAGDTPKRGCLLFFWTKKAAKGSLGDMLAIANGDEGITVQVMTDPKSRAWASPVPTDRRIWFTFDVPLPLPSADDQRFELFEQKNDRAVRKAYPLSRTITVSGQGVPFDNEVPSPLQVGVTCLYPLPRSVFNQPGQLVDQQTTTPEPTPQQKINVPPPQPAQMKAAIIETPAPVPVPQNNGRGQVIPRPTGWKQIQ